MRETVLLSRGKAGGVLWVSISEQMDSGEKLVKI